MVITRVEATCVTVADYLFDCPAPAVPDPATATEADVAILLMRLEKSLADCQAQARTVQAELADRRCKAKPPT